jgi:hypothetical protein
MAAKKRKVAKDVELRPDQLDIQIESGRTRARIARLAQSGKLPKDLADKLRGLVDTIEEASKPIQ